MQQKTAKSATSGHVACNSANKPSFKTLTQIYLPNSPLFKKVFVGFKKDGILINRDIEQNIQKLLIFAVFASYIDSILNPTADGLHMKSF